MRFAYIDSQGNEVPIPSIDALALRIELGAVGPETQLYDSQADQWGPARTHEIFHSLSRDLEGEEFVAPPPPAAPPPPPPPPAPSKPAVAKPEAVAKPVEEPASEPPQEESGDFDLGLTLADPVPSEPEEATEAAGGFGDLDLDLAPAAAAPAATPEPMLVDEPAGDGEGGFDFGDLGSGLEMEGSSTDDDMALESPMDFAGPSGHVGGAGDMQLEQPMSAFEPDSPPGWMEESGVDDVMDFSAVAAEEEAEEIVAPGEDSARQRRAPKDRPSPPKFKSQRSMSGPIVFVVLVVALGVGGYWGWPILQARLAERNAPDRPPVVMPVIPEDLLPQMRSIGQAAIADVVNGVGAETRVPSAPTEPGDDWLGGVYLGNASRYAGVEAFWEGMEAFVQGLRAADWQAYHDRYVELAAGAGLDAQAAAQVVERADSGFVAAQPERAAAYADLQRLADAALELHDFLVDNEDDILHRPGVTSATDPNVDPVLEISAPADDRERMLAMFDEITGGLDALGSLDRVTRDRLVGSMVARLQQVGIQ